MQDEAGVACVAAGGQLEDFRELAGDRVDPAERRAHWGVVESHGGNEAAVRESDHLRAADSHSQILPIPFRGKVGDGRAEQSRVGSAVAAEEAVARIAIESERRFVGIADVEQPFHHRIEFSAVAAGVESHGSVHAGAAVVSDAVRLLVVPCHAP